jgi:hypothetical protein
MEQESGLYEFCSEFLVHFIPIQRPSVAVKHHRAPPPRIRHYTTGLGNS